jgi:hypothetical protein
VSAALIAFVGLVYAYIAFEQFIWGQPWLGQWFSADMPCRMNRAYGNSPDENRPHRRRR